MDKTTGDQLRSPRDRVMKPEVLKQELYRDEMMATLGRMAGGMAHEFTSPLQAIKFIAQSTERFLEKNKISPQEIKGNLKRIVRVVDLMAGQVDHIKALARHDHLKTGPIELNLIIKSAFEFFEQQLKTRGITVKFNLQEKLPLLCANRYRLEQVFINLIQNSKDALEPVKGRKKKITTATKLIKSEPPFISITFEDNGVGIEGADKEKIFEPFFTTKDADAGKGMGLGLAIVKDIVSDLEGTIRLYDKTQPGTGIYIEIPVVKEV